MGRGRSDKALVNFNAGEWSPLLEGRIDLEKSGSACRVLENMLVETYGSLRRRPGTMYIATARTGEPPPEPTEDTGTDTPSDQLLNGAIACLAADSSGRVYAGIYQDGSVPLLEYGGEQVTSFLIRLNADGSYDETFSAPAFEHQILWVFIQPSGKIVIATNIAGLTAAESIMRVNTDGTQDTSFVPDASITDICGMTMLSDGRLAVVYGIASFYGTLGVLTANGAIDSSFAPAFDPTCYGVIAAAGTSIIAKWLNDDPEVMSRVTATGTIAATYAWDGGSPTAMAAQSDGRVIVAGYYQGGDQGVGGTLGGVIRSFNSDGSLAPGFAVSDESDTAITTTALAINGLFFLQGDTTDDRVRKLAANGTVVATFAPEFNSNINALAVTTDGGAWVAGDFDEVNGLARSSIVKLDSNGYLLT